MKLPLKIHNIMFAGAITCTIKDADGLYIASGVSEEHAKVIKYAIEKLQDPPAASGEAEAELFTQQMSEQFFHDPKPVRCNDCDGVCWQDEMVDKFWRMWKRARNIAALKGETK